MSLTLGLIALIWCVAFFIFLGVRRILERQAKSRRIFPLPFPQVKPDDWETYSDHLTRLGFVLKGVPDETPNAIWPSPRKIYIHQALEVFAELALWPTGEFQIQFTTLFADGSVRTFAGEKRITLSALSYHDSIFWKEGSLTSILEAHMEQVALHEEELQTRSIAPTLETYYDFLGLMKSSLRKEAREDRLVPKTVSDFQTAGFVYLEIGKKKKGLGMFLDAVALAPENPQLHLLAGKMALVTHDFKQAADSFSSALNLQPRDKETHLLLADALLILKKKRSAMEVLKRAKQFFPDEQEIFLKLGNVALEVGDLREAHASLEAINHARGASVELFQALGRLYRKMRDGRKSAEYFRLARVFARERGDRNKLPWNL